MNAHDKGILKRFSILVATLTAIGCLLGLIIFPPFAIALLIGAIVLWVLVVVMMIVFGYIFNG